MNALLAPRVKETSTTTGTGTLNLDGAVSGFQTFVAGIGNGNPCYYTIIHGTAWEVGIGIVTDATPDTLSRSTILYSSAGGSALNLGAGTKTVFIDITPQAVAVPQGHLYGLQLTNNGSDVTNDIDISTGVAASDDASPSNTVLINPASLTKRLDATWAAGTNQGGRLSSDALADGTWHVFAFISSAGVHDIFFSTSVNPTPPSGSKKRRIGSILRGSGAIILFAQDGDLFLRNAAIQDVSATNPGTSAVSRTLSVPSGISVMALVNVVLDETSPAQATQVILSDLAVSDQAPTLTGAPLSQLFKSSAVANAAGTWMVRTSTAAQIRSRLSASDADITLRIATYGWMDKRGRT